MTQPSPNLTSILHDRGRCLGFLRCAGPRGFTAYDADGQPLGSFHDKQAAIEAITDPNCIIKIQASRIYCRRNRVAKNRRPTAMKKVMDG
jgi:hypothetical protein